MSEKVEDLWPDDFGQADFVTPVTILKGQASMLGPKTNNLVEAEVKSTTQGYGFVHTLSLIAPALDNYSYKLIQVSHTIELYPVDVVFLPSNEGYTVMGQDALMKSLGRMFNDDRTKSLIRALIVQSQK